MQRIIIILSISFLLCLTHIALRHENLVPELQDMQESEFEAPTVVYEFEREKPVELRVSVLAPELQEIQEREIEAPAVVYEFDREKPVELKAHVLVPELQEIQENEFEAPAVAYEIDRERPIELKAHIFVPELQNMQESEFEAPAVAYEIDRERPIELKAPILITELQKMEEKEIEPLVSQKVVIEKPVEVTPKFLAKRPQALQEEAPDLPLFVPEDMDCPDDPLLLVCPDLVDDYDPIPWPKRLTVRHIGGLQGNRCFPLATNYTTLEVFLAPDYCPGSFMPFVDLRGHRFDNNTYAANLGIGARYIPDENCDCFCEMLGFNLYYDYRQGCIGYYNQISAGIEILGASWDFRANAYAPFGKRKHVHTCVFDDFVGGFFAIKSNIEALSYSFNGEFGYYLFNGECFSLYTALGPYYLAGGKCFSTAMGGEVRLRPQYRDYFALDFSYRYDDLFRSVWQLAFIFNLPLYTLHCQNRYPCCLKDRQIYQSVQRFEVMPLMKKTCWRTNF